MSEMNGIEAGALSYKRIEGIASIARELFAPNAVCFPVKELEIALGHLGIDYEISSHLDGSTPEGFTSLDGSRLVIREDVYYKMLKGEGRARFTVCHELGHMFLHCGGNSGKLKLCRTQHIESCKDPEWQANAFAGALLMPAEIVKRMNISSVTDAMKMFGVSHECAAARINIIKQKNL